MRARRLLSFSFTWSDDRSSISKGRRQIETEKDAIEVADRAPSSSRKRAQTYIDAHQTKHNVVVVLGKPLMRRVAIKVKVQNETRNSFVQSSSRVFETKKKDRRNARTPPTRTLSVLLLVLKSDRSRV